MSKLSKRVDLIQNTFFTNAEWVADKLSESIDADRRLLELFRKLLERTKMIESVLHDQGIFDFNFKSKEEIMIDKGEIGND